MNNKFSEVSEIKDKSKQEHKRLSSREVYQMMDLKQHSDLLRKIDSINVDFRESKIAFSKYWVESTYKVEGQTREYREFLITQKGCEFLAHKTTGTKGNLFTDKYMDRFEEMENQINGTTSVDELTTIDKVFGLLEGTKLIGAVVQAVVNITVQQRMNTLDVLNKETKKVIIDQLENKNMELSNESARMWKEIKDNQAVINMLTGNELKQLEYDDF
ncbi:Rha family transcriptional regulator [Clostridium butyricum]|uniref:Rha family transcriptional regulator n=1 Tax=Clostridium butyricum TaxID=1492 RepID=UPI0025A319E6|nr:Rha family transcriptional regulator [Clostridium butyricum]MDM8130138.1 Rha family transcriptional regulator [Clostridium butyricum]MDM8228265.1 Rha family transcriptional regulator [Clostridium butyricum]